MGETCRWHVARECSDASCACNREPPGSRNVTDSHRFLTIDKLSSAVTYNLMLMLVPWRGVVIIKAMTNSPEAIERNAVLEQLNSSAETFIATALCNIDKPFETPIRWHESRYQGINETPDFSIWTKVGGRTVYLTLGLDISERSRETLRRNFGRTRDSALWKLCVTEGNILEIDDQGSKRALLTIPHEGPVDIDHAEWRRDDDGKSVAIFKNDSYLRELGERPEVEGYLLDTLAEAAATAPAQQLQFIEEMVAGWRIDSEQYREANSVRARGSLETRNKLAELGINY